MARVQFKPSSSPSLWGCNGVIKVFLMLIPKIAHPHRAVDQLEDPGAQSGRHQEQQKSLPVLMQEPVLVGEAGTLQVESLVLVIHC